MHSLLDKNDARHIETHTKNNISQSEIWLRKFSEYTIHLEEIDVVEAQQ
jgi:hypothetical protein